MNKFAYVVTPDDLPELGQQLAAIAAQIILARLAEKGAIVAHVPPEPEKFLNLKEACDELNLSYPTLKKMIDGGQIPVAFPGTGSRRVKLSDIRTHQRQQKKS